MARTTSTYRNLEGSSQLRNILSFGILHWDLNFSKTVHDWDLESSSSFMDVIYSIPVRGNGEAKLCWNPSKRRGFEVKSC